MTIACHNADLGGPQVFYREAGDPGAPAVLPLHAPRDFGCSALSRASDQIRLVSH
jgi:hypothetical protein